ncbi:response regulator [Aquabacterium sp. J223]|uniref:response regulator n=1 Tax=Aquabacterium sp. J223 TaxID=2898431 RepID=UPI0021ADEAEF|nr:response regulator [Aquabacterium sp. J223]UUX95970.1 response regulator [Aquabacterium sp. J223]
MSAVPSPRPPTLLVVEDNPDDLLLLRRALQRSAVGTQLQALADGEAACAYLDGRGDYADRQRFPLPRLLLLDWKLPRRSGREVLQWLRGEPALTGLAVVVMSSSGEAEDVVAALAAGANAYVQKPGGSQALQAMVDATLGFWLRQHRALVG